MQDALRQIIEIDSQLTVLERVSNGQQDINEVFQESIRLATELGNKISQVNDGMINFARSGFRGQDLYAMTEVATLMSNVSDLTVDDSASSLIAAIKGFGMEASETIKVVDKLNEIDNNFAISTNDLSQVLRKATGAANTFGVSMDTMLGHATAIGQVTRESGNIIGNSLKTIYSRITTMEGSADILNSVGVSVRDMSGEMRPVEEILDSLSGKWSSLNSEQQQMIGIQLAGRFQLSRFLTMMQQEEESLKARTAALNSEGSAYKENEKFLDSYQAKLNALSNSWTEFSTTMGESVLGSSIVVVSESLTSIAQATSLVVDKFGLLPPLFGIIGASFLAFNNHTRASIMQQGLLATSLVRTGDAMTIATGRSRLLQTQLYNLTLAARATGTAFGFMGTAIKGAFTFLSRSFLPIAGFMALGSAISFVTNKVVEHKQEQKDMQTEIDKLTKSYADNESQIESLVSRYEQLSIQVGNGTLPETDSEYLDVQQKLYELLPSVAESVDEKGQAHLRSADAIRQELGYLNELARVDAEKFITNFHSKLADLNDQISETQNKLDEIQGRQDNNYKGIAPFFGWREKAQLEDMANSIIGQRDIEAKLEERKRLFQELGTSYAQYYGVQSKLTEEDQKYIGTIVDKNAKLLDSKKGIKEVESQVKGYIGAVGEIRSISGDLFDTQRIDTMVTYNKDAVKLFNEMSTAMKNGNQDWDKYASSLEEVGLKENEVTSILNLLKTGHDEATGATMQYNDVLDETAELEEEKVSATEKLVGLNEDQLNSMYELIGTYQLLSQMESDSAEKSAELTSVIEQLAAAYPHLANGKEINIEAIQREVQANDILLKATDELLKGTLTVEQQKTLTTALQAKKRIDILKQELAAQNEIVKKFNEMSKTLADNANTLEQEKLATKAYHRAKDLVAEIDIEMPDFEAQIDAVANAIDYHGRLGEAVKKSAKEHEESTYVSDKFKQAIEELNLALEKQRAIQAEFPKHSKEYQNALKKEIDLLDEKKNLLDDQTKSLKEQIKSGKIQQTGMIKSKSSDSSSYSISSGKGASSQIWNFFKSKGFTDNVVAAIMGNLQQESGLSSSIVNKSSGAFGVAQWLGSRKTALSNYAGSKGTSISNLQTQLDFLWKELTSTEKKTLNYLKNNQNANIDTLTVMFENLFERAGGSALGNRKKYANDFYSQFAGSVSSASNSIVDYYLKNFKKSSHFGDTKNRDSAHKGLDFSNGRSGDLVKALQGGKVVRATYSKSAGNWVVISQDDGTVAKYMHMQNGLNVKAGQRVNAGDTLGKVGNTGESYGAHLHLQIEQNGTPIDPEKYLQGLSSGETVAEQMQSVDEAKSEMLSLQQEALQIEAQMQELYMSLVEAQLSSFDRIKQSYADDLSKIDLVQRREVTTSKEWINQQHKKESILKKQVEQEQKAIKFLKEQIKANKDLNAAQKSLLEDQLVDRYQELYSLEQGLLDERIAMAEQIIDTYKQSLEAQKKASLDAIDEIINGINKEVEEADYKKKLEDAQKDRQELMDEIAMLSLDDSDSAKKRVAELNEQLQESDESIFDMQEDKAREDRISNLNEQKEGIETEYDNLLNDERKFAQMRSDIINANSKQIQKDLDGYYANIKSNTKILGQALSNNLIDLINQANRYLNGKDYKPIKVASMDTGGYTGNFSGGKYLLAHEKELILNKSDTSNLLKTIELTRGLLGNIKIPKLNLGALAGNNAGNSGNTFNINMHIDKLTGDQNGAKTLLNELVKGVKLQGGLI